MLPLMPQMPLEAPDEYVAFVERHLPRLRRDAALVVGEGRRADELYPDVLTDVAARWRWIALARRWLRRPDAADACLRRAFARRARRWQNEQITPVEVEVWQVEQLPEPERLTVRGWQPEQLPPVPARTGRPAPVLADRPPPPSHPMWSSMALRLAPVLLASARLEVRPLAEAAVAWWHAYEAQRRRRYVAAGTAVCLLVVMLVQVPMRQLDLRYAPAPDRPPAATAPTAA